MGAVDTTYTFTATDTITSTKMNNIIDQTTMTTDAIIGNTLDVASGKLRVRAQGITSNEMGANSVVSAAITDSNVTTAKIADANVTTAKIADANVTQAKLATNVATTGPAFHVYASTNHSVPNTGAVAQVQLNTKTFDTNSCFNTSTYRFTPNVAGYYQINLTAQVDYGFSNVMDRVFVAIRKNGNIYYDVAIINIASLFSFSGTGSILIQMNGSTDYIDATCAMTGTSTNGTIIGGSSRTYMSGFLARSA